MSQTRNRPDPASSVSVEQIHALAMMQLGCARAFYLVGALADGASWTVQGFSGANEEGAAANVVQAVLEDFRSLGFIEESDA
jgi:hypothetical protein